MSGIQSPILFAPDAYDVIAAAMNESERGRWFLEEHARRSRGPDTATLLDAIARIESAVTAQRTPEDVGHLRGSLLEMASAISRTKAEIAAISAPEQDQSRLGVASEALDAIVRTTERATTDILGAAEEVQEAAWTLRERGVDAEVCDRLDRHATQIYTACSFQDLTAQRISRVVNTLRYLEDRLSAMIAIWDSADERVPPGPEAPRAAAAPVDLSQSDVDRFIAMQAAEPVPAAARAPIVLDEEIDFVPTLDEPEAVPSEPGTAAWDAPDPLSRAGADEIVFADPDPASALDAASLLDDGGLLDEADLALASADAERDEIAPAPPAGAFDLDDLTFAEVETPVEGPVVEAEAGDAAEEGAQDAAQTVAQNSAQDAAAPAAQDDELTAADLFDAPARPAQARRQAELDLGDIDLMSIEEKLALFS